ncbi:CYCT1-5 [Scenedesmus sp. PABB004]|nr:CYCT1-5 [Scenedesmus sp. PABB004]
MQRFPEASLEVLKATCPSRAAGFSWKAELRYRRECCDIIFAVGGPLRLAVSTQHKAVVLLQRYFTRCSSAECKQLHKWAVATACVFLATKIDSSYHRLESVAHAAIRALRDMQGRDMEREYFNPDGTPGCPAYLSRLAGLVRDAELAVIFAVNFDFNVEVPASMVVYQLNELGLTHDAGTADQAVAAARRAAGAAARLCLTAKPHLVLVHSARALSLACIASACRRTGAPLDLSAVREGGYTPRLSAEELEAVVKSLPTPAGEGSRADSPSTTTRGASSGGQQGGTSARSPASRPAAPGTPASTLSGGAVSGGGGAASAPPGGGLRGTGSAVPGGMTGASASGGLSAGSYGEALTVGPRVAPSPISPDTQTSGAAAAAAAAAGQEQQQQQQQQQCTRKRPREAGLGQVQLHLAASEPAHKKCGAGVVA